MFLTSSKSLSVIFITTVYFLPWLTLGTAFARSSFTHRDATFYLKKFGWLNSTYTDFDPEAIMTFKKTIEDYQAFEKIPITGQLDNNTVEAMKVPRCGLRDKMDGQRFTLLGTVWESRALTYTISRYPRSPETLGGRENIDAELRRAFAVWERVTTFTFRPGTGRAFAPENGMVHFDDDERWTSGENTGINFFQVAAHEIGHALGLGHSEVRGALMFPSYTGYAPNFQLHSDDIQGIEALYGSTNGNPPGGRPTGRQPPGERPTGRQPPGERPTGRQPPGERPTGRQPPGERPTGRQPPGERPTGRQPPGERPTGRQPPGERPTGRQPPGERPTGRQPPGGRPTGRQPPGERPTGRQPPGERPSGRQPPGERPTGRQPPGERPTGRQPPGERPTGRQPPGERPTGRQPPGGRPTGRQPPGERPTGRQPPAERPTGRVPPRDRPTGRQPNGGQNQNPSDRTTSRRLTGNRLTNELLPWDSPTAWRSQWNPSDDPQPQPDRDRVWMETPLEIRTGSYLPWETSEDINSQM
ncbi:unnamed protein product [Orchesella dallaii]|uniref:Peptidase metallopeptidase domain-containing protein n=1 Tax=Orchesella dallaii TaxID=48710 RepID=A0ABP1RZ12_9HEXA